MKQKVLIIYIQLLFIILFIVLFFTLYALAKMKMKPQPSIFVDLSVIM